MGTDEFRQGFEVFGWSAASWEFSAGTAPQPAVGTWPSNPLERLGWLIMHNWNKRYFQPDPQGRIKSVLPKKIGWIGTASTAPDPSAWTKMIQQENRNGNYEKWDFHNPSSNLTEQLEIARAIKVPYYVNVTIKTASAASSDDGLAEKERSHLILEHLLIGFRKPDGTAGAPGVEWVSNNTQPVVSDFHDLGRSILRSEGRPIRELRQSPGWHLPRPENECDTVVQWEFRGARQRVENAIRIPYFTKLSGTHRPTFMVVGYLGGGAY